MHIRPSVNPSRFQSCEEDTHQTGLFRIHHDRPRTSNERRIHLVPAPLRSAYPPQRQRVSSAHVHLGGVRPDETDVCAGLDVLRAHERRGRRRRRDDDVGAPERLSVPLFLFLSSGPSWQRPDDPLNLAPVPVPSRPQRRTQPLRARARAVEDGAPPDGRGVRAHEEREVRGDLQARAEGDERARPRRR